MVLDPTLTSKIAQQDPNSLIVAPKSKKFKVRKQKSYISLK